MPRIAPSPQPLVTLILGILSCTFLLAQTEAPKAGDIYRKTSPAVVLIEIVNEKGEVVSTGSGFLISSDGKILTNYHVIAHAKQATVRLANKDAYDDVSVLDIDKRKDIALIKIKAVDLPSLALGKSSSVDVGDKVFSLSTPLGMLQNTLSEGIVSGIRLGDGYKYFQISAPISHGSSGGPVFNASGEVIGIAAATIEEGQNLNFAVPIDYAKGMLASTQPRPLASVYEPEPKPEQPPTPAANPSPTAAATPASITIPEAMKKGSLIYLEGKLHTWTPEDAVKELGESISQREGPTSAPADIRAYNDPTKQWRAIELSYAKLDHRLQAIYAYPWSLTWDQCKSLWGDRVRVTKNANGTKFYNYKDRQLHVLVDDHENVISVGLW